MSTTTRRIDHAALFAVLSSLADNKQAVGRRYAYWCNGAPALEAAVAAAAMTQDELGHARTRPFSRPHSSPVTSHCANGLVKLYRKNASMKCMERAGCDAWPGLVGRYAQQWRPLSNVSGTRPCAGLARTMIPSCNSCTGRALSTRPQTSYALAT
ncbi:MAG: hypothetical protein E6I97_15840 [Chloroflexi bacterium]|nr:MAG: hypothetical protein E6I97_15840 [Chloroflexota bacterium]